MGICGSKKSTKTDGMPKDLVDHTTKPSAKKTAKFIRQASETPAGQAHKAMCTQIDFITQLKELSKSNQGFIKKTLNAELKDQVTALAVKNAFLKIMDTREGQCKAALNDEVRTRADAQRDIETVTELKQTLQGQYKEMMNNEILNNEQGNKLLRQVSEQVKETIDSINQATE
jgi:Na+/phosphate symporter